MLPYANPEQVRLGLMDFDTVVKGNAATQLFVKDTHVGQRKTRVVAAALENRGFTTQLVERAFDTSFHPALHGAPARNEPTVALAGFDDVGPRRELGDAGFTRVIDAGLGAGPVEYLDMVLHTFPATCSPRESFSINAPRTQPLRAAYEAEIVRQVQAGKDEAAVRCGMREVAGVTVGAAFVGTIAGALAVADILRVLHGGENYSIIALDLRHPGGLQTVMNSAPDDYAAPAYTTAFVP
jgi:hypothetical protein